MFQIRTVRMSKRHLLQDKTSDTASLIPTSTLSKKDLLWLAMAVDLFQHRLFGQSVARSVSFIMIITIQTIVFSQRRPIQRLEAHLFLLAFDLRRIGAQLERD